MQKDKLTKKIYNDFKLDEKRNRIFFVGFVFLVYFILFWVIPYFLISSRVEILYYFINPTFLIGIILDIFKMIWLVFKTYLYLLQNPSNFDFSVFSFYHIVIAPFTIIIPAFFLKFCLPKLKIKYILLWSGVTVLFSIIYILAYMLSLLRLNFIF